MKTLDTQTALTVIRELNALDGSIPNVPDEQLAGGVCISLAARAWLEQHGGSPARWELVDLLTATLANAASREHAAAPLAMILHLKSVAFSGGLDGHEASGLRNFCGEKRTASYADALWHVAYLAVNVADREALDVDHNFDAALLMVGIDLAPFPEVLAALTGADQRAA